jgi:RHS repeat-associated protein
VVDILTDETGMTTYRYDSVGRSSGIDYPNGASIRYDYDLLSRVTQVREKVSATATEQITADGYDAVGNLKTISDPMGRTTMMTYDAVNRLSERLLPNGVKSTYGYDALDRVISIVHLASNGTVLASVAYERTGVGQPTKVTREDGSYTVFSYDTALRLTQEDYFSAAAGMLVQSISYSYDAAGLRTTKTDNVGSHVYNYKPGYQLDKIQEASETESYGYDVDGRVNKIIRDGKSITLSHDAYDQLTRVSDATTGKQVEYVYDGQGRRIESRVGNQTRKFLVAPGVGSGLDMLESMADGAGNLLTNYVYAGIQPLVRLDASGNPTYYLSDGMGSVIGLTDESGALVANFRYDGFGNLIQSSGNTSTEMGGDFRFQGQWLEDATGIYHFRARDYDAVSGRFLSRDPVDADSQISEAFDPYQFAYNNPYSYNDPSGALTLSEVTSARQLENALQAIKTDFSQRAKQYLIDRVRTLPGEVIKSLIDKFLPFDTVFGNVTTIESRGGRAGIDAGREFESILSDKICELIFDSYKQYIEYVWLEPNVSKNGDPTSDGFACGSVIPPASWFFRERIFIPRPDLIIKDGGPAYTDYARDTKWPKSNIIVEIKLNGRTAAARTGGNQFKSITNYAKFGNRHQYTPVVLYITFFSPTESQRKKSERLAWERGVALVIVSFVPDTRS